MRTKELYEILKNTTRVYRKRERVERRGVGDVELVEIFGYPHTSEASLDKKYEKVNMIFVDVLVDKEIAEKMKGKLEEILDEYPEPERLVNGPSYTELSPNLGLEQEGGLRLMALGKVLGFWKIISGKTLGFYKEETRNLAGSGFLMISGYKTGGKNEN